MRIKGRIRFFGTTGFRFILKNFHRLISAEPLGQCPVQVQITAISYHPLPSGMTAFCGKQKD